MRHRRLRVELDQSVCVGNAMCRINAPAVFVASPDGLSEVANPAADTAEAILAAAAECPVGAISVEDAETGELLFPEAQPANGTAAGPVTPG